MKAERDFVTIRAANLHKASSTGDVGTKLTHIGSNHPSNFAVTRHNLHKESDNST